MKRYIAMLLALIMLFSMAGCTKSSDKGNASNESATTAKTVDDSIKVGFILPAESQAPDSKARLEAIRKMQNETGLTDSQIVISQNVNKESCLETIESMKKKGCKMIFALGARYEEAVMEAAQENEEIQFCLEGGRDSIECGLSNVHTFNSRIYEAYYAAGVISGIKLNAMLNSGDIVPDECIVGFVAYKEAPETTTCMNAYYIGINKVCTQSRLVVRYVGKRGNYDADGEAARQLVAAGCEMMCTYTYTTAVASVCAENGIPVIGNEYNIIDTCPAKAISSTYTDWSVYYIEAVNALVNGTELANDWCGGYKGGVVRLTQLNDAHLSTGTAEKLIEVEEKLRKGSTKIFKTDNFTIDGQSLDTLVKENDDYKKYKDYVKDGQLKEQSQISAPIFEDLIDGITVSTDNYLHESEDTEESDQ